MQTCLRDRDNQGQHFENWFVDTKLTLQRMGREGVSEGTRLKSRGPREERARGGGGADEEAATGGAAVCDALNRERRAAKTEKPQPNTF